MNAPVTVKSSGVLVMSAPLTTCAVMLAMRPVPPSSPNAVPRTCEREDERRVKGGRREGVETPNRPLRRAAHRRVEGLSGEAVEHGPASRGARVREERERDDRGLPECREWTPGKVTAGRSDNRTESALWAPRAPRGQPGAFGVHGGAHGDGHHPLPPISTARRPAVSSPRPRS